MRAWVGPFLVAVSLGGCGSLPATERTPYLPPGVFGTYEDNDVGAINLASWAFAAPANTRGNPVAAAKAVIALEYLPNELAENPRWIEIDAAIPLHLGRARADLRRILGVRPDAPPQLVVNALLALALDLQSGNVPAAMQVLASPVFTLPPEQALQILANLPYVQEANLATSRADAEMLSNAQGRF